MKLPFINGETGPPEAISKASLHSKTATVDRDSISSPAGIANQCMAGSIKPGAMNYYIVKRNGIFASNRQYFANIGIILLKKHNKILKNKIMQCINAG